MFCTKYTNMQQKYDCFALHIWLLLSSYGIMYASLSFIDDIRGIHERDRPWTKGLMAILLGVVFYFFIGLRHLEGAKIR